MFSVSSPFLPGLECLVCLLVPRKEIYQCSSGHSICHISVIKVDVCPSCRVAVSGPQSIKVRNLYAENILNAMNFACCWKMHGCETLVARDKLSEHENICRYRSFNLCEAFKRSKNCQYQFSMMSLHNNSATIDKLLDHMQSVHKFDVANPVGWNESRSLVLLKAQLNVFAEPQLSNSKCSPVFQKVTSGNHQSFLGDILVFLLNFEENRQNQMVFSPAFAMLSSENVETSSSVNIKVSIKGQPNLEDKENWGDNCVPDIMWTIKPMNMQTLKKFIETPLEQRPQFQLNLPIPFILKHYVDSNGRFTIQYSIHNE